MFLWQQVMQDLQQKMPSSRALFLFGNRKFFGIRRSEMFLIDKWRQDVRQAAGNKMCIL